MYLRTLGGLELEGAQLSRPKPLLLLCYVSVEGSKSRVDLAELFYLDARDPMSSLRVALNHIRSDAEGALDLEGHRVDALVDSDARELLLAWERQDYQHMVSLYQGAFLDGFSLRDWPLELEEWVYGTREYLASLVRKAFLNLAQQVVQSNLNEAAKLATKGFKVAGAPDPEPEEFRQIYSLMVLGESPEALELKKLAQDYGFALEPLPVLGEASEQPTVTTTPNNLQLRSSSFVGRTQDLAEIKNLLMASSYRLLTLHGQGGIGKTRLVLQAGLELLQERQFKDGIYFVELEALTHSGQILPAIASVLGLTQTGADAIKQIAGFIGSKAMLIILDNFEHLADASTHCSELLGLCPNLKLLVTSREALNIDAEVIYMVKGLSLPSSDQIGLELALSYEVIQLFLDRAKRAKLSYQIAEDDLIYVIRLCHLLEGLPLGIELAAAGTKLMSAKEIYQAISEDYDSMFSPSRDLSERHKSLRATFDYSWNLLSQKEQMTLVQLAIFRGGFSRDAASKVVGATLPILRSLVDKALLRVNDEGRFDRHLLLYQYTLEKLEQDPNYPDLQAKHAEYFLALSEEAEPILIGKGQLEWLNKLELEHENLRVSLAWQLENDSEQAIRQASALRRYFEIRGYWEEGIAYLSQAITHAGEKHSESYLKAVYALGALLRSNFLNDKAEPYFNVAEKLAGSLSNQQVLADTLNQLAGIAWSRGDLDTSSELLDQSLDIKRLLNDKRGLAIAHGNIALLAKLNRDLDRAKEHYQEAYTIYDELADESSKAETLRNIGRVAILENDFSRAENQFYEALKIVLQVGDKKRQGWLLNDLACIACSKNQLESSLSLLKESEQYAKSFGTLRDVANVLQGYGLTYYAMNMVPEAKKCFGESLQLAQNGNYRDGIATAIEGLASVELKNGNFEGAVKLWGASRKLGTDTLLLKIYLKNRYEQDVAEAKAYLGKDVFCDYLTKGEMLSVDEVMDIVFALN
ncbi:MAG: tetratricopeptide repeat protein [Trueperaceae bacterium]|nr:tetratricopeptide repeat protein [Trueperaceae bacterium]